MFPVQFFCKTAKTKVYMETMLFFGGILRSYFARNILNFDIFDFKNHDILTADYFSVYLNKYDLPGHELSLIHI